jgi:ABC-type branched-subunit amino acid transport system permease subunit
MTYVGGLVVGVSASVATKYLTDRPWSGLPSAVPFLILIVVLLLVPARNLPRPRVGLGSITPDRPFAWTNGRRLFALAAVAALVALPFGVGSYLPVWINALNYVVLFGSLALLLWTSGQISLCHLAFAAVGATSLAHFRESGIPWFAALVLGGLAAAPLGALVAVPAIRMSGIYLGLMTIGFGILMQNVVFQSGLMFGIGATVRTDRPRLGFIDGTNDRWYYAIVLGIAVATMALLLALRRGQLGRLLRAMSESQVMLTTHGLGVNFTKLLVFAISAFFAGVAGGLILTEFSSVTGQPFGPVQSLVLVAVLGICGQNLLRSPVLAAVLYAVVPGYITGFDQNRQLLAFGAAAVLSGLALANRARLADWLQRASQGSAERTVRDPIWHRPTRDRIGRAAETGA